MSYKIDAPVWVNTDTIVSEVSRIRSLDASLEEKQKYFDDLIAKIKSVKTIKNVTITRPRNSKWKWEFMNKPTITVIPRKGLMPTSVGGDVGSVSSGTVSTGYANFFNAGESIDMKGSFKTDGSPTVSLFINYPKLSEADFTLSNPCTLLTGMFTVDRNNFKKHPISKYSLSSRIVPKNSEYTFSAGLSMISQSHKEGAPLLFTTDPCPYFKLYTKIESPALTPDMTKTVEAAILAWKKQIVPMLKANTFYNKTYKYGLSSFLGAGAILSPKSVPFSEKFLIGGAPLARGVDSNCLGQSVDDFPLGSDAYIAGGIHEHMFMFPQYHVNAHAFVNGAATTAFHSTCDKLVPKQISHIVTAGFGITVNQGGMRVEANIQMPLSSSEHLKFLRYQIGFSPVD